MKSNFVSATLLVLLIQAGLSFADDKPSTADLPVAPGPFQPTMESLKQYKCPDWFRDAKFGIWAHWGPQAVPMDGDWYARGMYEQGSKHYKYHLGHYGHPSQFGYKDIIPLWKPRSGIPIASCNSTRRPGPGISSAWARTTTISSSGTPNCTNGTLSTWVPSGTWSATGRRRPKIAACDSASPSTWAPASAGSK